MVLYIGTRLSRIVYLTPLRRYSASTILGIETSCDDTGVGIVRKDGKSHKIIAESMFSQHKTHNRFGGIIPPIAQNHHRQNIEIAVNNCLEKGKMTVDQIDAIAVTNRPGLPMSLEVGVRYAKHLSRQFKKPILPIHHMEAHALAARLSHEIPFPFICLLISGGHCQLVLVKHVNSFYLLGETIDDAPGEVLDKIARMLKLRYLPGYEDLNGGQAIELAASQANPNAKSEVTLPVPLLRHRDCQFSFAGIKNNGKRLLDQIEAENGTRPDEVIPVYKEFCRSLLVAVSTHLSHRVQRCIQYCLQKNLLPDNQTHSLVISGGVAANDFIFDTLTDVALAFGFKTFRPEKTLCSDNGVMIAWNGIERLSLGSECFCGIDTISVSGKCSLGESLIADVKEADLKCKWVKVRKERLIKSNV